MRFALFILVIGALAGGVLFPSRCAAAAQAAQKADHPEPRAFAGAQGAGGPVTSYPQMVKDLLADARRCPSLQLAKIGKSHDGRFLWLARVHDPEGPPPAKTTRIFALFRQHGDEPATTEAALCLLERVSLGREPSLHGVTLYIMPMVNPDGASAMTRLNGVGADLNRDWGIFSQPETQAVNHAVMLIRPQIVIDCHNWDTTDSYNANCIEVKRDSESPLAVAARAMQAAMIAHLAACGQHVDATSYNAQADPHLAHRWFTHCGMISFLIETHSGSPDDTADYLKRQAVYMTTIRLLAQRYEHRANVLNALEHLSRFSCRDQALFPLLPRVPALRAKRPSPPASILWPWGLLPYSLALFLAFLSRVFQKEQGQWTAYPRIKRKRQSLRLGSHRAH